MNYAQAVSKLPIDAHLSCSFGQPIDEGYSEIWRASNGRRWMLDYADSVWNTWKVKEI